MTASGATSLAGAFAMLRVPARRRGHTMFGCVGAMGAALGVLAFARTPAVAVVGVVLLTAGFSLLMGLTTTTIQQVVPDALRGRVMSVAGLTFTGVLPFAALVAGTAVDRLGFTAVYLANGALYAVAGGAILVASGVVGFVPPVARPSVPPAEPTRADAT
jgi:hypothetical protein